MSFFKVPSFLRSRSMDPQDAEVQAAMNAGQSRALQMVPEFEDDDDFLVDRSQADEQSSSQNSPVPQQPRQAQQLRQSQRLPAQQPPPPPAGNEFPFPERYESGQAEDSYANRNYYEYSQSVRYSFPQFLFSIFRVYFFGCSCRSSSRSLPSICTLPSVYIP